jgi:hypothetical protein
MERTISPQKRIALVAHDKKKEDLINWAVYNKKELSKHELVATGTTGKLLEEKLNVPVWKLFSGPLGGDQQLGALIAEGKINMIFFFWDPMEIGISLWHAIAQQQILFLPLNYLTRNTQRRCRMPGVWKKIRWINKIKLYP